MSIENLLEILKDGFNRPGHALFRSGQNKIYDYFGGELPKKEIEKFLSKDYAYTIHRNQARRRPQILCTNISNDTNFKYVNIK